MNSYLLSFWAPVLKKNKFSNYLVFREALYTGLFAHAVPMAGVADRADTAGVVGVVGAAGISAEHQRVKIKRAPYVIYK